MRALTAAVGVGYLAAVAFLVLNPDLAEPLRLLRLLQHAASDRGWSPAWVARIEFAANVIAFVPPPVIVGVLWGRRTVLSWTGAIFLCSSTIESLQWAVMGERTASAADVVANTLGATVGASIFACAAAIWSAATGSAPHTSAKVGPAVPPAAADARTPQPWSEGRAS